MVSERIGPVVAFKKAVIIARLPKARSGKILRGTMRKIATWESVMFAGIAGWSWQDAA
jgi:propionyl-CoA synthetase